MQTSDYAAVIRPKLEMNRTAVFAFFLVSIPIFLVLYWYTAPYGAWRTLVIAVQVTLAVVCLGLLLRQTRVYSAVSATAVEGNGIFSPSVTVPIEDIRCVELLPVYRTHPNEANTQLIVLGHDGRCLWRLRGQFWHPEDMRAIAGAIGRPITTSSTPLSEDDFFAKYPGSAYWFERSVRARLAVTGAVTLAVGLTLLALMALVGLFAPI